MTSGLFTDDLDLSAAAAAEEPLLRLLVSRPASFSDGAGVEHRRCGRGACCYFLLSSWPRAWPRLRRGVPSGSGHLVGGSSSDADTVRIMALVAAAAAPLARVEARQRREKRQRKRGAAAAASASEAASADSLSSMSVSSQASGTSSARSSSCRLLVRVVDDNDLAVGWRDGKQAGSGGGGGM